MYKYQLDVGSNAELLMNNTILCRIDSEVIITKSVSLEEVQFLQSPWHARATKITFWGFSIAQALHQVSGGIAKVKRNRWLWALVPFDVVICLVQGLCCLP